MHFLKILWDFSRPHTLIGSFLSITALYLISLAVAFPGEPLSLAGFYSGHYLKSLLAALGCNIYITGLNQVQDIAIDRINKPYLPLADGRLSKAGGIRIISVAGLLALAIAAWENVPLFLLILIIMLIGTAYSLPPVQLKKHHVLAAISILLVRGVLVNIGMPLQFLYVFNGAITIPPDVWPLTFFVVGFSLGIAWFKDIPDTQGDAAYEIKTLALTISPKVAFRWGIFVVALSYVGLLLISAILQLKVNLWFFYGSHTVLLCLFLYGSTRVQLDNPANVKTFYLLFWGFFFVEYIIYPLSYFIV
jgi:homogentisate phytyltransferase/homogentisate geranylgeranyltransferase